jgi:hypothetical protein
MRRALPLLALAFLAAGCGRAYTAANVQQALGTSSPAGLEYYADPAQTVFATGAAVSDLVIEETPPLPQAVYDGSDILVWRYRNSHEAWLAMRAPGRPLLFIVQQGGHIISRREANLVLIGESRRVDATLARLH